MTAQHTMSPGQVVHYMNGSQCIPAVIERPAREGGVGALADLIPLTMGLGIGRSPRGVGHASHAQGYPYTWHWPDECTTDWPETE